MTTAQTRGVSVIIAAYNEQDTIVDVINRFMDHPLIDEVIVVSDGSTDKTVERSHATGADVIALEQNVGKGDALDAGVQKAKHDILLFADADLIGLTDAMIALLVQKSLDEHYDMFTLIRDRTVEKVPMYIGIEYNLGGERIIERRLWNIIPVEDRYGFGVEFALNYYATQMGCKIGQELVPGLKQVQKERKHGLVRGFSLRVEMFIQCVWTFTKLFVFHRPQVAI